MDNDTTTLQIALLRQPSSPREWPRYYYYYYSGVRSPSTYHTP